VRCRIKYLEFGECNRSLRKLNNFYNIQISFNSNKVCVIGLAFGTHRRKDEEWVQVFCGGESEERKSLEDPGLDRKVILIHYLKNYGSI